jgi:hypothetical protein
VVQRLLWELSRRAAEYYLYIDLKLPRSSPFGDSDIDGRLEHCMGDANLSADEMKQLRAF